MMHEALDAAASGDGRVVMVVGEPGVGKTHLVGEFARLARRDGPVVLMGCAYEGDRAGAYGPFASSLEEYVNAADPVQLRADLGFTAAPLAQFLPALLEKLDDVPKPVALRPHEERVRLFEAVAHFVVALAARRTLVLILDNLHWADRDTLAMFRHIAHFSTRHRLLLIGTYRDEEVTGDHPLGALIATLRRETIFRDLPLRGMPREEVYQLVDRLLDESNAAAGFEAEARSSAALAPPIAADERMAVIEAIYAETEGNPFFVHEIVVHLAEQRPSASDGRPWITLQGLASIDLPRGVRQVIERRLGKLSEEANRLLVAGAACAGPFRFDVAAAVAKLHDAAALTALDEALRSRVLHSAAGLEQYDFTHALIRRTVRERLSPSRQVRLHREIVDALEHVFGERVTDHAAELAYHYHRSATLPGAERGVSPALEVALRAEHAGAFDQAVTFLRIALDLMPESDAQRGLVMGRLGLDMARMLAFDQAMPIIEEASTRLATQDPHAAADYLADATRVLTIAGYQRGGWRCAAHGLELVPQRRDRTWVWLKAHDMTRRRAEDPDDPGMLTDTPEVLEIAAVVRTLTLTPWERLFLSNYVAPHTRAEALERRLRDVAVLPCYDDQSFALDVLREGVEQSEREGRVGVLVYYLAGLARALTSNGDLAAARDALDRAQAIAARLPYSIQKLIVLAADNDLRLALDEGLEEMLAAGAASANPWAAEYHWAMAAVRAAAARTCAQVGRADDALAQLETVPRALEAAPPWITIYAKTACDAAAALWLLGCTAHAARIEHCLRAKLLPTDLRDYLREVRLSIAQVCALQGRYDEALEWFAQARQVLDRRGARTLRAIADYDEALMYERRNTPGDSARLITAAQAALRQFRLLGMGGWTRRATALLESSGAIEPTRAALSKASDSRTEGNVFRREGDVWRIVYEAVEIRLKDAKGLRYLACLLYCPRREFHATELVRLSTSPPGTCRTFLGRDVSLRRDLGDAGLPLDVRAAAAYHQRLDELHEELSEAESCQDVGRTARARTEIAFLTQQLAGAHGQRIASHSERARVAVTKGIAAALRRIRGANVALADHLDATIRRGAFCSYTPDPRAPITWQG